MFGTFSDPMTPVDLFTGRVEGGGGVTKTDPRKLDLRPKTRLSFGDYENLMNSPRTPDSRKTMLHLSKT